MKYSKYVSRIHTPWRQVLKVSYLTGGSPMVTENKLTEISRGLILLKNNPVSLWGRLVVSFSDKERSRGFFKVVSVSSGILNSLFNPLFAEFGMRLVNFIKDYELNQENPEKLTFKVVFTVFEKAKRKRKRRVRDDFESW